MRLIGVIDLLGGQAVHAQAGRRECYKPVGVVAGKEIPPGDSYALADAYLSRFDLTELYAADLDAIRGGPPQARLIKGLATLGPPLWLDAGASCVDSAFHALSLGATRVVVGLETLDSFETLGRMCAALGGNRIVFSLDLRGGEPLVSGSESIPADEPAHLLAARAATAGTEVMILLDLARVGTGLGPDFSLIARVREAAPKLTLLVGGGIRGLGDLQLLAVSGCDGALVATALHDGRLSAADVALAKRLGRLDRDSLDIS